MTSECCKKMKAAFLKRKKEITSSPEAARKFLVDSGLWNYLEDVTPETKSSKLDIRPEDIKLSPVKGKDVVKSLKNDPSMKSKGLIPTTTEIFGRKIKVKWDNTKVLGKSAYGTMILSQGEVHLASKLYGKELPKEEKEITYLHEITHFILSKSGHEKDILDNNMDLEKIVEDIAVGIYEAITKAR